MIADQPYEARPIQCLEVAEFEGWRVKVYGISAMNDRPPVGLVERAKEVAFHDLPLPAVTDDRYGVGFLVVHEGRDGDYALLDWWFGENMLRNRVYVEPPETEGAFEYVVDGPTACVWELHVMAFERLAWIDTVLDADARPDLDGYLAQQFEGAV